MTQSLQGPGLNQNLQACCLVYPSDFFLFAPIQSLFQVLLPHSVEKKIDSILTLHL